MKLNRIKLVNWRNHAETLLTLDKLTAIRGANHSGKSSIGQGIEFAFTGRCDATDAGGKGMAGLIRNGEDKAAILLDIHGNRNVELTCTLTRKPERTVTISDPGDPTYRGEPVKNWLESQKAVLSCLLNGRYFIGLDSKAQKAVLSAIVLPDTYEWPEDIKAKCNTVHISSLIPWSSAPFEVIEAAYKAAFDARTSTNRDIKNLLIPEPIAMPEGVSGMTDINEKLTALRSELKEIHTLRSNAEKARAKAESNLKVLETRIEGQEDKIRTEQAVLETIEVLTSKQVKDYEKVAKGASRLATLETELADTRKAIAGVTALLAQFDALDGKKDCPTCARPVTDEFLTAAMEPHVARKNELATRELELLREQKALGDVAGAARRLEQSKTDEQRRKRSEAIIAETDVLLRSAKKDLEELRNSMPPVPSSEKSEQETELEAEIESLEKSLNQVAAADYRAKEIILAKERQKKLTQAASILDSLVAYFGKDGVKADLLKQHIGEFTDSMNSALASWGYACSFEIEPYGFRVTNLQTNTTLGLELLSGSERLRFSVAFQVALAQVSTIRLVVIDEADILDSEGRGALYPMLLEADIDQAIVIGTDERMEVPEVEGAVFYMMGNGTATLLQPVAA